MRGPLLAVLWLGLSSAAGGAQEPGPQPRPIPPSPDGVAPAIAGPDRVEPYTIGVFKLPETGDTALDPTPGLSVEQRGSELFVTGRPGKYTLTGTWIDFEARKFRKLAKGFTIGDPPPPPPPPPPPGPRDPLVDELRTLYAAEASFTKAADVAVLGEVYKLMAAESAKPEYKTPTDLNAKYKSAVTAAIDGRLIPVRTRCSKEIEAAAGDPDAPLTDDGRKKLAAAFARLATLLPQVTQ